MKVPSHYVIATFQLYGSLMLCYIESPDYFFRVREIRGQATPDYTWSWLHAKSVCIYNYMAVLRGVVVSISAEKTATAISVAKNAPYRHLITRANVAKARGSPCTIIRNYTCAHFMLMVCNFAIVFRESIVVA